jgi:hypothetical protein
LLPSDFDEAKAGKLECNMRLLMVVLATALATTFFPQYSAAAGEKLKGTQTRQRVKSPGSLKWSDIELKRGVDTSQTRKAPKRRSNKSKVKGN